MKLLYAEDERAMSEAVVDILNYHKYTVDAVYDGADALYYAEHEKYDGIILDVMMPKLSGLEVLRQLREKGVNTPVLLLTARGELEDRIEGLDLGADDYLPKPFAMGELLARLRAMLRRREEYTPDVLRVGDLALDRRSAFSTASTAPTRRAPRRAAASGSACPPPVPSPRPTRAASPPPTRAISSSLL